MKPRTSLLLAVTAACGLAAWVWACPHAEPSYYSLRASKGEPPMAAGSKEDWVKFLPTGNFQDSYDAYFNPFEGELSNLAKAYLKAVELEKAGDFKSAGELFRKIDSSRKTISEWNRSIQITLSYKEDGSDISVSGAGGIGGIVDPVRFAQLPSPIGSVLDFAPLEEDILRIAQAPPSVKNKTKRQKAQIVRQMASVEGKRTAFFRYRENVPPVGAWQWTHGAAIDTRMSQGARYREAADRIEIYTPENLVHPKNLAEYLKARRAYVEGESLDIAGLSDKLKGDLALTRQKDYLAFLVESSQTSEALEDSPLVKRLMKEQPSAKLFLQLGMNHLRASDKEEKGLAIAAKYFQRVLTEFPKSRYADDACYVSTKIAVIQKDRSLAGKLFRRLATEFDGDDMVPAGALTGLAIFAQGNWEMGSLEATFWELAGGKGAYSPNSDPSSLGGSYPAYLYIWRSERKAPGDLERFQLLEKAASSQSPEYVRRQALYLLGNKSYSVPVGSSGRSPEKIQEEWYEKSWKHRMDFLESYPEDPRATGLLESVFDRIPNTPAGNKRLAALLARMGKYHNLPSLKVLAGRSGLAAELAALNGRLAEKLLVDADLTEELLNRFPESPWAFPKLLEMTRTFEGTRVASALPVMRRFQDRYLAQKDRKQEWADILRVKVAMAEMRAEHWIPALEGAKRVLADGRENLYLDEAYWVKAQCMERLGWAEKARAAYEELVERYPKGAEAQEIKDEEYAYGQKPEELPREKGSSPYSLYAYQKLCPLYEKEGKWEKAMDLYFRLGYQRDLAMTLDFEMPLKALQEYVRKNPEAGGGLAGYSLAIRLFRRNDFPGALAQLDKSPNPASPPNPWSEYRSSPDVRARMVEVQGLYEEVRAAAGQEAKSYALYDLGRYFFHRGRTLYYNGKLWEGLWFNDSETVLDTQKPEDDSFHLPFFMYRDAAYQFHRIIQEFPGSPVRDKALYSYALCRLKPNVIRPDEYVPVEDEKAVVSDLFLRVPENYPQSSLADDALYWAGYTNSERGEECYARILKEYPDGDLLKFFAPDELLKSLKGSNPNRWPVYWDEGFWKHNEVLRKKVGGAAPPEVVDSSFSRHTTSGKPFSGWFYYRSPGGSKAFKGTLEVRTQGLTGPGMEVDLDGKSVRLTAGKAKIFKIQRDNWPPGTVKWVYLRVDAVPEGEVQISHSMKFENQDGVQATANFTVDAFTQVAELEMEKEEIALSEVGTARDAGFTLTENGESIWRIQSNGGDPLVAICDQNGKLLWKAAVEGLNGSDEDTKWLEDDTVLNFPPSYPKESKKEVLRLGFPGKVLQRFELPKSLTRSSINYADGVLSTVDGYDYLDGKPVPRGQVFGHVSGKPGYKKLREHNRQFFRGTETSNLEMMEVAITKGTALGFERDDFRLLVEGNPNSNHLFHLGLDSKKRIYFLNSSGWSSGNGQILVYDPAGKLLATKSFSTGADEHWSGNNACWVLPEGKVVVASVQMRKAPALTVIRMAVKK